MGLLDRLEGKPPRIPEGAVVRLAPDLATNGGLGGGVVSQRPYWTMLDPSGQETGDRHIIRREGYTDLTYATAYCAWVQGQGSVPMPDYPIGAV